MKVTQLWVYPIKSLQPTAVDKAVVTRTGFLYDRRFMLLKDEGPKSEKSENPQLKNMAVAHFPEMTLFHTSIRFPEGDEDGEITVTYSPPDAKQKILTIPLQPDTSSLTPLDINMHGSQTTAYRMGSKYDQWFSECFGYQVVFAFVGQNLRPVLFEKPLNTQKIKPSWFSSVTSYIPSFGATEENEDRRIAFQDCAAYLVVTEESLQDISARLPEGEEMDITKFRPNIVLSGADAAWDEDFWAEIQTTSKIRIQLQHNCIRCRSINIDFSTGKPGTGEAGQMLKLMQKDRRVDTLKKYSPVFGRYGFLAGKNGGEVEVGDVVEVSKRNDKRTGFDWPGLA